METALTRIREGGVIAIVRGISPEQILYLGEALLSGGLSCIEVTFDQRRGENQEQTLQAIRTLKERFGTDLCPGAGTVMTKEQVQLAAEAGAEYMISPDTNPEVIRETKRLGKLSIPGALTPTEAAAAHAAGADIVKLFPAGVLGPSYIKALTAPLSHIAFSAVGGITPENCGSFLKAGCIGVGCGGNLVSRTLIEEGRLSEITETAKAYRSAVEAARS